MSILFLLSLGGATCVAYRMYQRYQIKQEAEAIARSERTQAFLQKCRAKRFPKLKKGEIGDVLLKYRPDDPGALWDTNIPRWSRTFLDTSWGFCGTGPWLLSQDILYQFTADEELSQSSKVTLAIVKELVQHVPDEGGEIKADKILALIKPFKEAFDAKREIEREAKREAELKAKIERDDAYYAEQDRLKKAKDKLEDRSI